MSALVLRCPVPIFALARCSDSCYNLAGINVNVSVVFLILAYFCYRKRDSFGMGFFVFAALLFGGAFA